MDDQDPNDFDQFALLCLAGILGVIALELWWRILGGH